MDIIAHRGAWAKPEEKNTLGALLSAIRKGWGVETDIRDFFGEPVISHDPPSKKPPTLRQFLSEAGKIRGFSRCMLAFNIKSDGLHDAILPMLDEFSMRQHCFFFDMSAPTLYQFSQTFDKENLATGLSDIESGAKLSEKCGWVWVDGFESDWDDWAMLKKMPHRLAVVSPELHGRAHGDFWERLSGLDGGLKKRIWLCTDFPQEAKKRLCP